MSFITKNANVLLLFLILLSSVALVGATVFFQSNFERINTEYNQKVQQLQIISKELEAQQTVLGKIKSELSVKVEREEQLGEQFVEVKENKEQLETQKAQLESSNEQLENELVDTASLLQSTQIELDAKKDVIKTMENEAENLNAQIDVCEDTRDDYKAQRDACTTAKALCTCP